MYFQKPEKCSAYQVDMSLIKNYEKKLMTSVETMWTIEFIITQNANLTLIYYNYLHWEKCPDVDMHQTVSNFAAAK